MRKPNSKETASAQREAQRWAQGLEAMAASIGRHFSRAEARERAGAYLRGLLAPVERKNGWQLAEALGDTTPYGIQHLLGRAAWDAEAVRDDLRAYVVEHLGEREAVLVLDETGFLKKGTHSVGVQRQYSGTAGRIENCQIGVFLAYASARGHALIDRELYLPEDWAEDAPRREQAGVPEAIGFATKGQLARKMLERAVAAALPFAWVTGDEVYGNDSSLRLWCEREGIAHVLAVRSNRYVWSESGQQQQVATVAKALPPQAWQRLSCGKGAKGERYYDWALVPLLTVGMAGWQRGLLVRRQIGAPQELAYYLVFAPEHTGLQRLVQVAGTRWTIEESFERAKGEVGLDQYEVRSWHGWYRHITLAMLAQAFLTVMRAQSTPAPRRRRRAEPGGRKKPSTAAPRIDSTRGAHPAHGTRSAASALVVDLQHCADSRTGGGLVALAAAPSGRRPALPLSA